MHNFKTTKKTIQIPYILALLFLTSVFSPLVAQHTVSSIKIEPNNVHRYTTELVVADLQIPWGMAFLPDGSILITELFGEMILFKDGIKTSIEGLPEIRQSGQGGLMDIELHPKYKETGWIYFAFGSPEGEGNGANTAIMRAKLKNNKFVEKELIYKATPNTNSPLHWGSRIEFDNNGYLYFAIGDRFKRDHNPQDIKRDGGKIYRIHDNGDIPDDNPFVNIKDAKKAVYSYGHRNQQGMAKHPETGKIWIHEHGPKGGDEINIIKKGKNYGWPKTTYGVNYSGTEITKHRSLPGIEDPVFHWTPSIAPSGMAFITSDKYPEWKGDLLVGSLKFQYLELLKLDKHKVTKREKLFEMIGRVRNVRQGPDGYIYIAVERKGIFRIIPKK